VTGRANLQVFADTVLQLARMDGNVLVVTSDSRGSGKLVEFGRQCPGQIVEVGIAEQNLVGIAAGLASVGKTVYAVSPASFLTARALEQIKNDVCYSDRPVNLIGISAGVSYGALGSTHHSLHDVAALRALHNIVILAPADNFETAEAVRQAASLSKPVYIRLGKRPMEPLHKAGTRFRIGKAIQLRRGQDLVFFASGETVARAADAADQLARDGINAGVLSFHTLKPLDQEAIRREARRCGAVITVEEHSVCGGLGEACAAVLLEAGVGARFKIIGLPDEETVTGSQLEIYDHYGISVRGLAGTARRLLG